ncbi:hypothetical protein FXF50_16905 [Micromonospora sp. AP08]|uniref:Scr1 family TA system antitoxin-like transcriptional regulator n=1 Tax=Micromonospora sp. AP08 TaxID=2604467 RepID=UPI0011D37FE8|nr:Scr1 family TA system antitoxin-like transcriptional regulator [Micromonospora sp. AP08]TYB36722.1 hypothetical protein FXF50_16905 [Micromonospora sp. AP08]
MVELHNLDIADVDAAVATRMQRQQLLYDTTKRFEFPLATTPQNSFQMYDDVAVVETFVGETTYRDDEAATYTRAIERLWEEAVTGEDARRLIVRAAQELRS